MIGALAFRCCNRRRAIGSESQELAVALAGQGVTLDGVTVVGAAPGESPAGFVGYKIRKAFERQLPAVRQHGLGPVSTLRCAGVEYLEILAGRASFSIYRRTKPWDHAAGALMLVEAGGGAVRFDGKDYAPAQPIDSGIIGAPSSRPASPVDADRTRTYQSAWSARAGRTGRADGLTAVPTR